MNRKLILPLVFRSTDEAQSLEWIAHNNAPQARVLASPEMGLFIPAQTGRRVIYRRPFETVNAAQEKQAVITFFSGSVEMDRTAILVERQVNYVFIGERELSFHPEPLPATLKPVHISGTVTIFAVRDMTE